MFLGELEQHFNLLQHSAKITKNIQPAELVKIKAV